MPSEIPQLSLLMSLGNCDRSHNCPPEREISRGVLLSVAPDREALLMGSRTIEEIRQTLKLRIASPFGHWLYHSRTRREYKLEESTTRLSSVFGRLGPNATDENTDKGGNVSLHVIRRVLSASSIRRPFSPMRSIASTLDSARLLTGYTIASEVPLSTKDKLISPRPLGATHMLVIYATNPSDATTSPVNDTIHHRKGKTYLTYPEVVELPINDLLFILNTPNLPHDNAENPKHTLPRRLHTEMPRVLMHVPHLQTFPELVIYLHTKNQAELFRKLIPQWMRDLMHPLPHIPSPVVSSTPGNVENDPVPTCGLRRLLAMLIPACWSINKLGSAASSAPTERSVSSIAMEISQTALESAYEMAVLNTATLLDAFRDNLCHVGYFGKDLWHELELSRDILRRAISYQAKVIFSVNNILI